MTATDTMSGVNDIYYRIDNGTLKSVSVNGEPYIDVEGANNTLEYWSVDKVGNVELHHFLYGIKLERAIEATLL